MENATVVTEVQRRSLLGAFGLKGSAAHEMPATADPASEIRMIATRPITSESGPTNRRATAIVIVGSDSTAADAEAET